jgi:hypothetical protein
MSRAFLILLLMLAALKPFSQVQLSAGASFLQGSGYYDNHAYLLGGGMAIRYMIVERLFLGISGRTYKAHTTAYEHYNAEDRCGNLYGTLDYMFVKRRPLQPYIGIGIGVSAPTHMISFMRVYRYFVMYAFKAGMHLSIGKSTGFFTHVEYNYTPGEGKPTKLDGIDNTVLTEPISKYVTLDWGLYIRLYPR